MGAVDIVCLMSLLPVISFRFGFGCDGIGKKQIENKIYQY